MDENLSEPIHSEQPEKEKVAIRPEQPEEKKRRGRPPKGSTPEEEKVAIRLTHDYWHFETGHRHNAGSVIELPKKWAKSLVDNKKAELTIDW